jgi:glycosyltransferase involved in cell wall biosynthesis
MVNGLSLVMATRNESESISEIIRDLGLVLSRLPLKSELIVADFSEDHTLSVAITAGKEYSVKVVPFKIKRRGRGYAVRKGIEIAKYDLICLIDGDGNHDPKFIPKMLEAYRQGCIIAPTRFPPLGWSEEHTFLHYFGNRLAAFSFNLVFGGKVTDITNGYYLFSRDVWNILDPNSDHWSLDMQILCRALKRGVEITEIAYFEPKRKGGKANLNLLTAFWRVGGRLLLESVTQ